MDARPTANDRFKAGFPTAFWLGLIGATALHALALLASPTFVTAAPGVDPEPPIRLVAAEPRLPQPPEAIRRPAKPVVADRPEVDEPFPRTVPTPGNRIPLQPPAPRSGEAEASARIFTRYEVAPVLRNAREVRAVLERVYPAALREAGIGGVVSVWFHIDEAGRVRATELAGSSGYDAFDRAALEVADVMTFSPAETMGRPVPVWVSLEIRFEVR